MTEHNNSELEQFRDMVKRFLDKEIKPSYDQWEKDGLIPREVWRKLGENWVIEAEIFVTLA